MFFLACFSENINPKNIRTKFNRFLQRKTFLLKNQKGAESNIAFLHLFTNTHIKKIYLLSILNHFRSCRNIYFHSPILRTPFRSRIRCHRIIPAESFCRNTTRTDSVTDQVIDNRLCTLQRQTFIKLLTSRIGCIT